MKILIKQQGIKFYLPIILIGVVCILLISLFIASRIVGSAERTGITCAAEAASYLSEFGWECSGEPSSVRTVEIPDEFTESYRNYNQLQKTQGFDLTGYRSKTAVMYTFRVLNHPSGSTVFGNVLVYGDRVIAGDLVSYAIDGFQTGLDGVVL